MEDPLLFALASLTLLSAPGPTNALLAIAGAAAGLRRCLPLVVAEVGGYLTSILTVGLVLGPALARAPTLANGLRIVIGAYLVLLALRLWRHGGVVSAATAVVTPVQMFVTTLLNPKALVLALAVVPFGTEGVWRYLLALLVMLVATAFAWLSLGAAFGRAAMVQARPGIVARFGAGAVGAFGLLFIATPLLR
jgi:threonine/homoserine/homoserine lactone efflux protein